ncbi:MAG: hypothetical protein R3F31_19100 [Verrucomicrobiales bacterium]
MVVATTDKVTLNRGGTTGIECDPLGGHDPYSSSKAAAKIALTSPANRARSSVRSRVRLASARAGNVIGGGD